MPGPGPPSRASCGSCCGQATRASWRSGPGAVRRWTWPASSASGPDRGRRAPNWLFFGEQHRATDFYYEQELAAFPAEGTLTRLDTAFSRDQRAKAHIQDRMREHGPLLWSWLQDGAHIYVCGEASRMARDVDQALREIATAHGGLDETESTAHVKQLAADKRYLRDVY
jgi:sulfite reductase (NADPH) flavoprotein alpha-component